MEKIGVLNCSHIINFGSVLQSYATEKIVRDITGQDVYSIRYRQKKDWTYIKNYLPLLLELDVLKFKMKGIKRKVYLKWINKELRDKCKVREAFFADFVAKNFNCSEIIIGFDNLRCKSLEYSCFVLGSDQVWHPINYGSHFYTMEWIPQQIKKIVYAASFGVSSIPNRQALGTKFFLERIDAISVRENRGAEIVLDLTGRCVPVVVDPTILLDEKEWTEKCKPIDEKDYIFCYFLGDNSEARKYALRIKEVTGLKIVSVPFMDEINKIDFGFGDVQKFEIGPGEFLSYIRNAKYVITDSFHGTVFSIIYHKKFVVFNRFALAGKESTNSRIDTLLSRLDLEHQRIIDCNDEDAVDLLVSAPDYENVDKKIEILKKESIDYLKKALNDT